MNDPLSTVPNRLAGALLGLAAGAAAAESCCTGGEAQRWGSGETELAIALARTYVQGYSRGAAAEAFLGSLDLGSSCLDPITRSALERYRRSGDACRCGVAVARPAADSGAPLARCLPTGLVRPESARRAAEAAEVAAITHSDRRSVDSCVVYCDLAAALVAGVTPAVAVTESAAQSSGASEVGAVLAWAPRLPGWRLCPSGAVLDTLAAAVWALCQPGRFEDVLEELVSLGGDGPALAAAGGLLGAARGLGAIPERVVRSLAHSGVLLGLTPQLLVVRRGHRAPPGAMAGSR